MTDEPRRVGGSPIHDPNLLVDEAHGDSNNQELDYPDTDLHSSEYATSEGPPSPLLETNRDREEEGQREDTTDEEVRRKREQEAKELEKYWNEAETAHLLGPYSTTRTRRGFILSGFRGSLGGGIERIGDTRTNRPPHVRTRAHVPAQRVEKISLSLSRKEKQIKQKVTFLEAHEHETGVSTFEGKKPRSGKYQRKSH